MSEMYDAIERLCIERGCNITKMCRDLNIPRSVFSELKSGRTKVLSGKYIAPVAEYFGVTADYLLGSGTKKEPAAESDGLTARDRRDIARDLEKIMRDLEEQDTLMFDGDPASPEARESIRNALAMGLEYAKKLNKEKYTPKKYRKSKDQEE